MIASTASPSRFNLYPQNYTIYVNRPVPTGNCYYCLESAKNLYALEGSKAIVDNCDTTYQTGSNLLRRCRYSH